MNRKKDKIPWKNITQHLTGHQDEKSGKALHDWLENKENQQTFDQLKALWDYCGSTKALYNAEKEENLEELARKKRLKPVSIGLLIALIVLMALLIFYFFVS